jgi:ferric-dicitrate binding protein FerR (iron transport regulator)
MVQPPRQAKLDRRTALVIGAAAYLWSRSNVTFGGDLAGEVEHIVGTASAVTKGQDRELTLRAQIYVDDLIKTGAGARLRLRLGRRTTLRLGERAQIKIDRYLADAGGDIDLLEGAILFERPGKPAATELKFRSPYGLIAVRGTRFFAGPSRGVFGVFVGAGEVEVTSAGSSVFVGPRQGTDIRRVGAPPSSPAFWKRPRIREALASVT